MTAGQIGLGASVVFRPGTAQEERWGPGQLLSAMITSVNADNTVASLFVTPDNELPFFELGVLRDDALARDRSWKPTPIPGHTHEIADINGLQEYLDEALAKQDPNKRFLSKLVPKWWDIELLKLSPGVFRFLNRTDNQVQMTKQYFEEMLNEIADQGAFGLRVTYWEYIGLEFDTLPGVPRGFDYDTNQTNEWWWDGINGPPRVENFNPCESIHTVCKNRGMKIRWGTGRNGDSNLLNDLYIRWSHQGHNTQLTLSATSGTNVTVTAASAIFSSADVGKTIIYSANIGIGVITSYTSTTSVKMNVTVTFSTTTLAAGAWFLDPTRYGLLLSTRLTNAINRTRLVAAGLWAKYGDETFYGFYISHESDHVQSSNDFFKEVNLTVAGANPRLRDYGVHVEDAPGSPIDLADTQVFSDALRASGCDIWSPQDSVGIGYNFTTMMETYVPYVAQFGIAGHAALWEAAIKRANLAAYTYMIQFEWTIEYWRMGTTPAATLTLSATSGNGITITQSANVLTSADVNKLIWGRASVNTGRAKITAVSGATITANVEETFGGTTLANGSWALTTSQGGGYAEAYPQDWTILITSLLRASPYIQNFIGYAYWGFPSSEDPAKLSLKIDQTNSAKTDFATRSQALYTSNRAFAATTEARLDSSNESYAAQDDEIYATLTGGFTDVQQTEVFVALPQVFPEFFASKIRSAIFVRGAQQSGTAGTLTIRLLRKDVFGVEQEVDKVKVVGDSTPATLVDIFRPEGKTLDARLGLVTSSGTWRLASAYLTYTELVE